MDNMYYEHVSAEDKFRDKVFEIMVECLDLWRDIDNRMMNGDNPARAKILVKSCVIQMFRLVKPQMIDFIKQMENATTELDINDREAIKEVLEHGNHFDSLGPKRMGTRNARDLFEWISYFCEIYGLTSVKRPKKVI